MTAAPCPLQVIAAAVAVHVQHLTAGVEAGDETALHGAGVKFIAPQTARRHLRLIETSHAGDGQREALDPRCDTVQIIRRQFGNGLVGEARRLAYHLPQTGVEGAGQQRAGFPARCGGLPPVQPRQYGPIVPVRQQIQRYRQACAAGGCRP